MRKLAAIMFADMTGYSALMQENEQLARIKRKRFKEVLDSFVPQHNGEVLQYYGDGSMSIFQSAIEATRAAIQIQKALLNDSPKVDLRVGLHLGDVDIEGEAIFGDGVNIASRIESLAVPGAVFLSEKIYDEVRNQEDIDCVEMGQFELKNIKIPVRVFAIKDHGLVTPTRNAIKGKITLPQNRLAVLPFVNMSADPENEYFSDGITEELLNALTRVKGIQITSRTSAFAFKGKSEDIREIATKLNVDKVLEGSVRKAGNRVRVSAQLINASDGYHIWSENYDRELTDIFVVQDEISSMIADKLREGLPAETMVQKSTSNTPANLHAYNLFLKGLHHQNKLTPTDAYTAIDYYENAIAVDINYGKAYACMAGCYAYLGATGQMQTGKAFEAVHKNARKALDIDAQLSEGHLALGSAYLLYDWRWDEALNALKKAIELNPAATQSYQFLAFYHLITGQKEKAIELMEKALVIDPLSPMVNHYLADMYFANERYDDALLRINHILELFPKLRISLEAKGWAWGMKGDWQKALDIFEEVHKQSNHPLKGITPLAFAHGRLGNREKALSYIAKIEQRAVEDSQAVMDADLTMAWWGIGDKEKTIFYMYRCIDKRLIPVAFFLSSPIFQELKEDVRFFDLKKQLNLQN
ncbi:MAG TPA: adenylate/guanylate cyclase domain-containing protein [Chitinophagaceae bacterium]|nr:adenylate/guanylate cyclase domain-containing protein [Chitinophagaceae bacterium]